MNAKRINSPTAKRKRHQLDGFSWGHSMSPSLNTSKQSAGLTLVPPCALPARQLEKFAKLVFVQGKRGGRSAVPAIQHRTCLGMKSDASTLDLNSPFSFQVGLLFFLGSPFGRVLFWSLYPFCFKANPQNIEAHF